MSITQSISRFIFRNRSKTFVKVYSNLDNVILSINGNDHSSKSPEKGTIMWDDIKLQKGNNGIIVRGEKNGKTYVDDCVWVLESPYSGMNLASMILLSILFMN